jgi:transcriptional regulator with XRE-family HTH domain
VPSKPLYRRIVGGKIRAFRSRADLTIEKLAEKADLHPNFIGEVERGNYDLSVGSLIKIAKALGVRARDLVRDV